MSTDILGSLLTVHAADPEAAKTFISGLLASSGLLLRYFFFLLFFFYCSFDELSCQHQSCFTQLDESLQGVCKMLLGE